MRIGHSYDIHRLESNRDLILGGINIPYHLGLLGHSDADCLLHAIAESLLGSLALGDLGTHFPDTDPKYKGVDSTILLKESYDLVKKKGYTLGNLDCMIYCEAPKLKPHINSMRDNIALLLETSVDNISIKATTFEKLGPIGNNQAIASECTCLVYKKEKFLKYL